jgi:UDPglucose--hexose-1-phosphate uridylyltransferase
MQPWLTTTPHRRWNPLRREWTLVSPHRTARPWQGQMERIAAPAALQYDPACYLCPGNQRAGGQQTPQYGSVFVFENDFAALTSNAAPANASADTPDDLLRAEPEGGVCRVLCFDPRHDLTLATMPTAAIRRVVDAWAAQEAELGARPDIAYVQIFENRGEMMGASNPHPHGQIWATGSLPNEPATELLSQTDYRTRTGRTLLLDLLQREQEERTRIVHETDTWVALVPFWAVWPFELLLLPTQPVARLHELSDAQRTGLADMLQRVTAAYNRVFDCPFPYSMGFHPAPADGQPHAEWQLHAHFYPPLLRSATIRKFMVGFELLGSPQRDITPEAAAETLRQALAKA